MPASARPKRTSRSGAAADADRAGAARSEKENNAPAGTKKRRDEDPTAAAPKKTATKKRRKADVDCDDGFEFKIRRKSQRLSDRQSNAAAATTQSTRPASTVQVPSPPPDPLRVVRPRKHRITPPAEELRDQRQASKATRSTKPAKRDHVVEKAEKGKGVQRSRETTDRGTGRGEEMEEIKVVPRIPRSPPPRATQADESEGAVSKIRLPTSDTPINRKNQQYRQQAQSSGRRRSSLSLRGRRGSSLMSEGIAAEPHDQISHTDFYKHISQDQMETVRMKQLLSWCARRALTNPPGAVAHYSNDLDGSSSAIARVIEEEVLKEVQTNKELSSWFLRDDAPPPVVTTVVKKPNPRNIENVAKLEKLREELIRLKSECESWTMLLRASPHERLSRTGGKADVKLFDPGLLRTAEAEFAASLERSQDVVGTARRLVKQQGSEAEFQVDQLRDGAHKLVQYGEAAERLAALALDDTESTLAHRDHKVQQASGTNALPLQEVLRSLSRLDR